MKISILSLILVICSCTLWKGSLERKEIELEFLSDSIFDHTHEFLGLRWGGISSLSFDKSSGKYLAISDDKEKFGPFRFYLVDFAFKGPELRLGVSEYIKLQRRNRDFYKHTDFEAIVSLPNGNFLVASEGDQRKPPRLGPALFEINRKGKFVRKHPIPKYYFPNVDGKKTKGAAQNKAFESLALSKDEKYVFAALEDSLVQDGPEASIHSGSRVRMLKFEVKRESLELVGEYLYPTDPIPNPENLKKGSGVNGVVEIISLTNETFLVMERSFLWETKTSEARIYAFDISNATNIKGVENASDINYLEGKKRLVLDLSDIKKKLRPGFRKLDNLEGMVLGPELPDGSKTLILASDNNFSKYQKTQFLSFKIVGLK